MLSSNQALRLDRIVVKAPPLLELVPSNLVVFLGIPAQHVGGILEAHATTERLDHGRRLLQHIIGVDYTDLRPGLVSVEPASHRSQAVVDIVGVTLLRGNVGANQAHATQVVEGATQLVVPGLGGIIVVEACHLVEGRNGAAEVGGDTVVGVADEEGKMELGEDFRGHHGRIAWLGCRVVRVRLPGSCRFHRRGVVQRSVAIQPILGPVLYWACAIQLLGVVAVGVGAVAGAVGANGRMGSSLSVRLGAHAPLDSVQRWRNAGGFAVWWEEVVHDVLHEDTLALLVVSISQQPSRVRVE